MARILFLSVLILGYSSAAGLAQSCRRIVQDTISELRVEGGTEIYTLRKLFDACRDEADSNSIPQRSHVYLREIDDHIASWDAMQKILVSPPSSMKKEMRNNRPEISSSLFQTLVGLQSSIEGR